MNQGSQHQQDQPIHERKTIFLFGAVQCEAPSISKISAAATLDAEAGFPINFFI
jgi:hypothetical protein